MKDVIFLVFNLLTLLAKLLRPDGSRKSRTHSGRDGSTPIESGFRHGRVLHPSYTQIVQIIFRLFIFKIAGFAAGLRLGSKDTRKVSERLCSRHPVSLSYTCRRVRYCHDIYWGLQVF